MENKVAFLDKKLLNEIKLEQILSETRSKSVLDTIIKPDKINDYKSLFKKNHYNIACIADYDNPKM